MKFLLFMVIATFVLAVKCQNLTEVVQTNKGPVQGLTLTTVYHQKAYSAFFGIPFAKPPVGDLRFQAPVEPNSWSEVLNATRESPACLQARPPKYVVEGNEDCLYLNVYTPLLHFTNIKPLKPVLVWVYGGAFEGGSTAKSVYGPDRFLEEDVIMVDMNYRVNALGFLSLGIPGATGNQGLKDQNLAMRWVQKNIAKFGGDPKRVTIMGQSAGGVSITYHIISPKSRGLFQRAIVQSGSVLSAWGYKPPNAARWSAYELAKRLNITVKSDSDLLASLKVADLGSLVKAVGTMSNSELPIPLRIAFVPTSESGNDAFISDCPISYFESGNFNHVPTMLGYTAEETILFATGLDNVRYDVQQKLLSLTKVLDPTGHNNLAINVVNSILNDTVWEIIKASSIYAFSGPVDLTQRYLVKHNGNKPVYFYRLSYRSNENFHFKINPHINGTSHGDDQPFLFHMENLPTDPNNQFNRYSKRVVSMWANFIKSGNPTPPNSNVSGGRWTTSGNQGLQLDIGNGKFVMKNRFIVSRDATILKAYYNGLPVTSECKNYPFGNRRTALSVSHRSYLLRAKMKRLLLVVIAIFATAVKCQNFTEVVYTEKGPIRGAIFKTVYNKMPFSGFLGIPYAEPPLSKLRFEPPVEIGSWKEVLNTTEDNRGCPQLQFSSFIGNEDCLYLNVYTPALEFGKFPKLKPVVVWIHGGGFTTGTGAKNVYGPDRLLEKDLVTVAMNYRLGPFGFLSLGIPGATGNQGLKDQNLALQWVQKNIAKFGGDPNRVTIMGESAGAVSMTYHMISPKSRGLFHQVIVQSGSALAPWGYKSPTASKWTAYELAKRINITAKTDSDVLAALKKADVKALVTEATNMTNEELPIPLRIAFVPTSETGDDAFIDDCPLSYFQSGNYSRVPTLLGYTAEETILYTIGLDNVRYEVQEKLLSLTKVLDPTGHNNLAINVVNSILNDTVWEIIKASSVYDFSGPVDLTQRFLTRYNDAEPAYFYRLSYNTNHNYHKVANPHINGTSHADDLPLIFYFIGDSTDPSDPYNIYCDRVITLWANFIKYGNPTPSISNLDGTHWQPSGEQGLQLDIGNEKFLMHDRFIVSRDALVQQIYYDGLPVTTQCKNYNFSSPSVY
ncbi:uncharacterized protein LOC122400376 [Colletes gigas]|uniref:uncharacterized protein LOC122400376 n=1 Tax=Colletes gigas TaxID=935657 RepID=UPI001C9AF673|nr:uncharacterized protein LOC122400376 [Colletes gigas]